jgi:hypothetical protein
MADSLGLDNCGRSLSSRGYGAISSGNLASLLGQKVAVCARMVSSRRWTHGELLIALNLYHKLQAKG